MAEIGGGGRRLRNQCDRRPDEAHLHAAALDDSGSLELTVHSHWAERLPWLPLADDLPKHPGSADHAPSRV